MSSPEIADDLAAVRWIHGSPEGVPSGDPLLQVVALDGSTFVLRQSKDVNFEAPFLYLLIGAEAALLHDTGATAEADRSPIRRTVDALLEGREVRLLVTHSHGHGDHRASDPQFADLPSGAVAAIGPEPVAAYFGIDGWPAATAVLDLGDPRRAHRAQPRRGSYELGTEYQPDEVPLPLAVEDLHTLERALEEAGETLTRIHGRRFVVVPIADA